MPNTAISIRESMTCLASKDVEHDQFQEILEMFNQLGSAVKIDEKLMDAATVLGACGTAFAMRYIRANIQVELKSDLMRLRQPDCGANG